LQMTGTKACMHHAYASHHDASGYSTYICKPPYYYYYCCCCYYYMAP
jgi:hypothetical protein